MYGRALEVCAITSGSRLDHMRHIVTSSAIDSDHSRAVRRSEHDFIPVVKDLRRKDLRTWKQHEKWKIGKR